jgi:hypothetical protein
MTYPQQVSFSGRADAPVIGGRVVRGGYSHGNKGEDSGTDSARAIRVKVEQTNRKPAKHNRKLQP